MFEEPRSEEVAMSVATEFAPTVFIPERARPVQVPDPVQVPVPMEVPDRLASVSVLHAPGEPIATTWRLTRRGVVVLTAVVLALGAGLIWLARLSAPQPAAAPPAPHAVTVAPGDTLWSIATRVAPGTDPRAEVAALQQRNRLTSVDLVPGQVLRVP
jgi:LysM repeat protein